MPSETPRPQAAPRTITVSGQRLWVAIRSGNGTRTPLLLMNGFGVNLEVLQPFVDALNPAIEVIRFDVPGTGGSPAPLIPYRFSVLAWLVTKMLDQLGYHQIDVLGVSWGGALAQQFAFQYPVRCRRLILVSTGTGALMIPRKPLSFGEDGHTTTLYGPGLHGGERRSTLWGKGTYPSRASTRVRTFRSLGWPTRLLLSNAGRGGLDQCTVASFLTATNTDHVRG